jgi:hypothetical protein
MATSSDEGSPLVYGGDGTGQSEVDDREHYPVDYAVASEAVVSAEPPPPTPPPVRPVGRRIPLFKREGEAADALLTQAIQIAKKTKDELREAMLARHSIHVPSIVPIGASQALPTPPAMAPPSITSPGTGTSDADRVSDPKCEVKLEPKSGVTEMVGRVTLRASRHEMALISDPRAWSGTGGVVAASFIVSEDAFGQYSPCPDINGIALGRSWKDRLLYEYARSEVASFENILRIGEFTVGDDEIVTTYSLHDCLVCTFGAFSAPGGLTLNEGHVKARRRAGEDRWDVEVLKRVRVRDLTPRDPGNRYDFGQWINSTIGAALSQWVRDASIMSPVL